MKMLISYVLWILNKVGLFGVDYWELVFFLMVKLMNELIFYEGMSFSYLEIVGVVFVLMMGDDVEV